MGRRDIQHFCLSLSWRNGVNTSGIAERKSALLGRLCWLRNKEAAPEKIYEVIRDDLLPQHLLFEYVHTPHLFSFAPACVAVLPVGGWHCCICRHSVQYIMRNSCSKRSARARIERMGKSNPLPTLALIMGALHHAAISRRGVQGLHGSQELIGSGLAIIIIKSNKVNTSQITLFTLCSLTLWHFQWAALFLRKRRRERKRYSICYQYCCCQGFNTMWTTQSGKLCNLGTAGDVMLICWDGSFIDKSGLVLGEPGVNFSLLLLRLVPGGKKDPHVADGFDGESLRSLCFKTQRVPWNP